MMQTARILQAVTLLLILAMAASCATSNEYVNKIFKPRNAPNEDIAKTEPKAIKFLEFDSTDQEQEAWVKDWINNKTQDSATDEITPVIKTDSAIVTIAPVRKDTLKKEPVRVTASATTAKPEVVPESPLARSTTTGGVRTKAKREQ